MPIAGEKSGSRRWAAVAGKHFVNPIMRRLVHRLPGWALLETKGRKSGRPHVTPVGNGKRGDTFWLIAEHGVRSDYVRNILADPMVRVFCNGRWRTGKAAVMRQDDPLRRQKAVRLNALNAAMVRFVGRELTTIRIDFDVDKT